MVDVYNEKPWFRQRIVNTCKGDAMHHHTGTREVIVVRVKMCATISNIHRNNKTLVFGRRACFRPDKWHGRNHQEDERQYMSRSCQSEKSHEYPETGCAAKERDCWQRSRIHFVTKIMPSKPWIVLTFQRTQTINAAKNSAVFRRSCECHGKNSSEVLDFLQR